LFSLLGRLLADVNYISVRYKIVRLSSSPSQAPGTEQRRIQGRDYSIKEFSTLTYLCQSFWRTTLQSLWLMGSKSLTDKRGLSSQSQSR